MENKGTSNIIQVYKVGKTIKEMPVADKEFLECCKSDGKDINVSANADRIQTLEALREKVGKKEECEFCEEESDGHDYMNGIQTIDGEKYLVLETSEWDDYYDCYNDVRIAVEYCPKCGKRLEVEHDQT